MFAKLLKYEWKSNVRLLTLLGACALGLGCISALILRLLTANWELLIAKDEGILFIIPAILFLFAAYIGIILYASSSNFILLFRFYRSHFSDEGYLTFTLPVKTSHIFLSSALNILIWNAITIIVVLSSLAIAIVLGPVWPETAAAEAKMFFEDSISVFSFEGIGYILATVFNLLATLLYGLIAPMSAVVLGATAAKKHKVLAIIGIMIGLTVATNTASGLISGILMIFTFTAENTQVLTTISPLLQSIVPLFVAVGGYFLSIRLMKKKLNLP